MLPLQYHSKIGSDSCPLTAAASKEVHLNVLFGPFPLPPPPSPNPRALTPTHREYINPLARAWGSCRVSFAIAKRGGKKLSLYSRSLSSPSEQNCLLIDLTDFFQKGLGILCAVLCLPSSVCFTSSTGRMEAKGTPCKTPLAQTAVRHLSPSSFFHLLPPLLYFSSAAVCVLLTRGSCVTWAWQPATWEGRVQRSRALCNTRTEITSHTRYC